MSLKDQTVIVNDEDQFLSFDLIWWVPSDLTFYSTASLAKAVAGAKQWWRRFGIKRASGQCVAGRRVFVVTNYGYEDERRQEVTADGTVGEAFFPNEPQAGE